MAFDLLFSLPSFLRGYYNPEGKVADGANKLPFGWYKYISQSYLTKMPVDVVLSMGQHSVERGYAGALKHLLGTLFAGSAMGTTESSYQDSSTSHPEPSSPSYFKAFTSTFNQVNPFGPDFPSSGPSLSRALGHPGSPPTSIFNHVLYAMRLRHKVDNEDPAQREELLKPIRRSFMCGICLEEMPDDFIACPDPCGHTFCRECLRGFITARLEEHRFPILCPICTAGKGKGKGVAGEVSESFALDLGINDEQYNIWAEMEMAAFAILLHCRKCQRTMFVAKDEYDRVSIVTCPLPDCSHVWCKQCQQSIDRSGPKHSCDGTSELDHLMKQQGWKYCPTCKTPIQKVSGCNHMSCRTPACNTHFCYKCGDLMVRSSLDLEIGGAVSAHFEKNCMQ